MVETLPSAPVTVRRRLLATFALLKDLRVMGRNALCSSNVPTHAPTCASIDFCYQIDLLLETPLPRLR